MTRRKSPEVQNFKNIQLDLRKLQSSLRQFEDGKIPFKSTKSAWKACFRRHAISRKVSKYSGWRFQISIGVKEKHKTLTFKGCLETEWRLTFNIWWSDWFLSGHSFYFCPFFRCDAWKSFSISIKLVTFDFCHLLCRTLTNLLVFFFWLAIKN